MDGLLVPDGVSFSAPPTGRDSRAQVALTSAGQEPCSAHQLPDPTLSSPMLKTLRGLPVLSPRLGRIHTQPDTLVWAAERWPRSPACPRMARVSSLMPRALAPSRRLHWGLLLQDIE